VEVKRKGIVFVFCWRFSIPRLRAEEGSETLVDASGQHGVGGIPQSFIEEEEEARIGRVS